MRPQLSRQTARAGATSAAFRAFYDRHVAAVLHFLRYQVRDEDRPDVASRTFTFAANHFDRFEVRPGQERDKAERSWILTIARNAARTWRQKKRQPDDIDFETLEAPDNPERDTAAFELAAALLWTLPEHLRTLYLLHHREEMTHEELAAALGLPLGTVKSRLAAAQAELDAKIDRLAARERMRRGDYVRGAVVLPFGTWSLREALRNVDEEVFPEAADHLWNETVAPAAPAAPPFASAPLRAALAQGSASAGAGAAASIAGAKDGGPAWLRTFSGDGSQKPTSLAVDALGGVAIAGEFTGTADFGGAAETSALGSFDSFIARFDANGSCLWSRSFAAVGGRTLALSSTGQLYVSGWFNDALDFGGESLVSKGGSDVFFAAFDDDGEPVFQRVYGGDENQEAFDVAGTPTDKVILVGHFQGEIDLGTTALKSAGGRDVFVAKVEP